MPDHIIPSVRALSLKSSMCALRAGALRKSRPHCKARGGLSLSNLGLDAEQSGDSPCPGEPAPVYSETGCYARDTARIGDESGLRLTQNDTAGVCRSKR